MLHARSDPIRSFTAATDAGKYYWAGKIAESARMGNGRMGVASDLEEGGRVCTAAAAANGLFRPSKNNGRSKERERERERENDNNTHFVAIIAQRVGGY